MSSVVAYVVKYIRLLNACMCLYAFENKIRSTAYNKREHNPPTQTHMHSERT
jgi:hypothetical protein